MTVQVNDEKKLGMIQYILLYISDMNHDDLRDVCHFVCRTARRRDRVEAREAKSR